MVAFRTEELISCLSAPETEAGTSYQEEEGERLEFVSEDLAQPQSMTSLAWGSCSVAWEPAQPVVQAAVQPLPGDLQHRKPRFYTLMSLHSECL